MLRNPTRSAGAFCHCRETHGEPAISRIRFSRAAAWLTLYPTLIRVPEALGHDRHDLQREQRRLAHQELKAPLVHGNQPALRPGNGAGASRVAIDERHLAEDATGRRGLGDRRANQDIDFASVTAYIGLPSSPAEKMVSPGVKSFVSELRNSLRSCATIT